MIRVVVAMVTVVALAAACGQADRPDRAAAADPIVTTTSPRHATSATTAPPATTTTVDPFAPPAWLGQRPLPVRPDGFGEIQPTPDELVNRAFQIESALPPPSGDAFESTDETVPADVAARSTWSPACPVTLDELRYVTVTYWGFDGEHHRGELLVNASAADDLIVVFRALDAQRFPIEEMRVVDSPELDLPPTGDGNNTSAFVCRAVTGATSWSQHAYGLAVDVDPFQNPYVKDDLVVPELSSAYLDRSRTAPGMLHDGDPVVAAFAAAGWDWGGHWNSLKDYQHFSANGR